MTKPFIVIFKIQSGVIFLKLNSIQTLWKLFSKLKFTLTANIIYAFKFPTLDVINVHLLSHRHTVSSILSKWVTLIVTSTTSDLSFSPLTQKMCTQTAGLTPFLMEAPEIQRGDTAAQKVQKTMHGRPCMAYIGHSIGLQTFLPVAHLSLFLIFPCAPKKSLIFLTKNALPIFIL